MCVCICVREIVCSQSVSMTAKIKSCEVKCFAWHHFHLEWAMT